jgi:hypothetical protein
MASKETWSTRIRHDSDAEYWFWRDELISKLALVIAGGYLAADETNVTAGAGARPGANTEQSYAVYHLADSLHATAPIYIRFGFGTSNGAQVPRIQVTVGTSTNGSGVLGGTALSTADKIHIAAGGNQTSPTVRNSYACCVPGFLGLSWKQGSGIEGFFQISRTVDSAGAITVTGSVASWGASTANGMTKVQAFNYSPAVAYTASTVVSETMLGFNPQRPASTLVGSDTQAFVAWMPTPAMRPVLGVCGVLDAEAATGSTFPVTLVGATSRTYIALTPACGPFGPTTVSAGHPKYAMLWE